jgi:hypothetical protein
LLTGGCRAPPPLVRRFNTFEDWVLNVQFSPHGSTHLFIGGAFGECADTLGALKSDLSYSTFHRVLSKASDLMKNM